LFALAPDGGAAHAFLARSNNATLSQVQAVALAGVAAGGTVQGVLLGLATVLTEPGLTVADLTRPLYLSSTAGIATKTPPGTGNQVTEIGSIVGIVATNRAQVLVRIQKIATLL
jgi:hypothetical protein